MESLYLDRRSFLKGMAAGTAVASFAPTSLFAGSEASLITKQIPSSGEKIPVIGMGTWQTFNVGHDEKLRDARTKVLKTFLHAGGTVIDSSPMYGSSQDVIGYGLEKLKQTDAVFSADKIWTSDGDSTTSQLKTSQNKWHIENFTLMQVHNLVAWKEHLETLRKLKENGKIKYIGVTTSHGRRHDELANILQTRDIDFVQLTYNLVDREAERKLLPIAAENDIAVIANRPFRGGSLVDRFQDNDYQLPNWADKIECSNWPQFLLKFIVSHPAMTCAIPATIKVEHMKENIGAARGSLPSEDMRQKMLEYATSKL